MTDGDPSLGFFEALYRDAGGDAAGIPWASMSASGFVTTWLDHCEGNRGKALVIGCGLGDDAEALAGFGWNVTAFDIAPTAIRWCRERFPSSTVDYVVADLFDLPPRWLGAFSLVVEVLTLQSLAPAMRGPAFQRIAELVAPAGRLLVETIVRRGPSDMAGPPWPLAREELDEFCVAGLAEVQLTTLPSPWQGFDLLNAEYRRPVA